MNSGSVQCLLLLLSCAVGFSSMVSENEGLEGVKPEVSRAKRAAADASVATYIRQGLENFRSLMKTGIPEFGIAALEPVPLDNISFDGDANGVRVVANFSNITMYGLSTMDITRLDVNLTESNMKMELRFKNWTVVGRYNMTGKVIRFIPLYGNGSFDMQAYDVVMVVIAPLIKNSNGSLSVRQMTMDVTTGDVDVHFHDLYGGGSLSGVANQIASFFGGTIFRSAKPKIVERMVKFLVSNLNRYLKDLNVNKL